MLYTLRVIGVCSMGCHGGGPGILNPGVDFGVLYWVESQLMIA